MNPQRTILEYQSQPRTGMGFLPTYLTFLACTACPALVLSLALAFWVPRFSPIFSAFGGSLPLASRILLELSSFPQNIFVIFGLLLISAGAPLLPARRIERQRVAGKRSKSGWLYLAAVALVTMATLGFVVYGTLAPVFQLQELIR